MLGLEVAPLFLTIAIVGLATWLAYRDVTVSARLMLLLEAGSVSLILCVALCVLAKQGFHPDMVQLQLQGVTAGKLRLGLVLAIFCFVGFESATSLGTEAKDPLRSITARGQVERPAGRCVLLFLRVCRGAGLSRTN